APPKEVAAAKSPRRSAPSAVAMSRPGPSLRRERPMSETASMDGIFVEFHEFAEGRRNAGFRRSAERINAELVFEPGDKDREAEGVKAGFEQGQIIGERREGFSLLARDSLNLRDNC